MTTSNIIRFPCRGVAGTPACSPGATSSSGVPIAAASSIAAAIVTPPGGADSEARAEFAEIVIGTAIRFARRKGRSMSSLPPQMRKWLRGLCDQGDPTARVVRDWLDGNRRFLTSSPASRGGEGA